MIFAEVSFECIIVDKVLRVAAFIPSITNMTPLVLVSAVSIQLVVTIESLPAKSTFGMTFEASLIGCTRVVIAEFLMLP